MLFGIIYVLLWFGVMAGTLCDEDVLPTGAVSSMIVLALLGFSDVLWVFVVMMIVCVLFVVLGIANIKKKSFHFGILMLLFWMSTGFIIISSQFRWENPNVIVSECADGRCRYVDSTLFCSPHLEDGTNRYTVVSRRADYKPTFRTRCEICHKLLSRHVDRQYTPEEWSVKQEEERWHADYMIPDMMP